MVAFYTAGALASSAAVGAALGAIGAFFLTGRSRSSLVLVGLVGVLAALGDLGIVSRPLIGLNRQTDRLWSDRFGERGGSFLWGIDLGLGFSTIRVASLYWVVALVTLTVASVPLGALILCCYGLGLSSNLIFGSLVLAQNERQAESTSPIHDTAGLRALRWAGPGRIVLAAALGAWSTFLFATGVSVL
jgi:hypothetical protein